MTVCGTPEDSKFHSKNASFTVRNYLTNALLYGAHICQQGDDNVIKGEVYCGTSKSAEGYGDEICFKQAREEEMKIAIHWQGADSSSEKAVRDASPGNKDMKVRVKISKWLYYTPSYYHLLAVTYCLGTQMQLLRACTCFDFVCTFSSYFSWRTRFRIAFTAQEIMMGRNSVNPTIKKYYISRDTTDE